jgi:hypothetical protein
MGKEAQFARAEVAPIVAGDSGDWRCDLVQVRRNAVLVPHDRAAQASNQNRRVTRCGCCLSTPAVTTTKIHAAGTTR